MNVQALEKEAGSAVAPILDAAAYRVERVISTFRACMATLFLVLHSFDGFGPEGAYYLMLATALCVLIFSGWIVHLCNTKSIPNDTLARVSLSFDGVVFLVPAFAHSGHPDWNLLSGAPMPLLTLMVLTAGLRFSKPITNFGIGIGLTIFTLFAFLDFTRQQPPELNESLLAVLLMSGSVIWTKLASRETRRLVMEGALSTFTANIDALTGLRNRRFLREHLDQALSRARTCHQPLCVIMADIDHFKAVNDTHGHDVGDQVLKEVASKMKQALREADLVARYGGEEFAFVLEETDLEQGCAVAERVRASVEELEVNSRDDLVKPTLSLGVAQLWGQDEGIRDLLKRADEALYVAKESGRNRVEASMAK